MLRPRSKGKKLYERARSITSKSEHTLAFQISKALAGGSKQRAASFMIMGYADEDCRMKLTPEELTAMVRYQVGALKEFVSSRYDVVLDDHR